MPERQESWTDTFYLRLEIVFLVLADPVKALEEIDDPHARTLLEEDNLQRVPDLYACCAAIETKRTSKLKDPHNQYVKYFRRLFPKYTGKPYPQTVER